MGAQPLGLARSASEPHPLFVELVEKTAPRQLELLADRRERGGERVEGWVRPLWEFWAKTLPAALDTEFGDQRAVQPTLRTLLEHVRGGTPEPRVRKEFPGPRRAVPDDDDWGTAPRTSFDKYPSGTGERPRRASVDDYDDGYDGYDADRGDRGDRGDRVDGRLGGADRPTVPWDEPGDTGPYGDDGERSRRNPWDGDPE
jgi:hypothetical protein